MEPNDFTLLVISGPGVPPYSARGLTQTLDPIAAAIHHERAVNGELIDLSAIQMRKYKSKISCSDQNVPAIAGLWPGSIVTVDCVIEMAFLTANPGAQERTAVPGSVRTEGDYTFYRPRLTMIVVGWSTTWEEFARVSPWSYELEEQ